MKGSFVASPMESQNEHISLSGAKETLLITLRAKALDSRQRHSVLNDAFADSILKNIDYDFNKLGEYSQTNNIVVIRAKQFDEWLKIFLSNHDKAVVVNLACGLDSRVKRVPPGKWVSWFDVDFNDVIEIRRRFFVESDNYKMIASSVLDTNWLKQAPTNWPTIILAEGLLEYLEEHEVKSLFNSLTSYFEHGEFVFDVMNSLAIQSARERLKATTGATHKWAVDRVEDVEKLDPQLQRISELPVFKSAFIHELPIGQRLLYKMMSIFPRTRYMMRLLRYGF